MRISSWNLVRVPKAMLWAHVQSFSLKFSPYMWLLALYIFARLFWRARETLVKQPPCPRKHAHGFVLYCFAVVLLSARRFMSRIKSYGDIDLGWLSSYNSQYWILIGEFLWNSPQSDFIASAHATILYNEFEIHTFQITAISELIHIIECGIGQIVSLQCHWIPLRKWVNSIGAKLRKKGMNKRKPCA